MRGGKLRSAPSWLPWAQEAMERAQFYVSLMSIRSELPIDVLIPAAEKDADVLACCIQGVRKFIKHPIQTIYVVAPASKAIQRVCAHQRCTFVNERDLVDLGADQIALTVNGIDRSSWIYQQFLKLSSDALEGPAHCLAVDADTVFVRPQVFERRGRIIFNYSDEYHEPYFEMHNRLLGERVTFPASFTSHQMLFDRRILPELKRTIVSIHGCDWKEAILQNLDRNELSGFSDYDTYGQYMFLHYPRQMAIEYWFNLDLTRTKNLQGPGWLSLRYGGKYKTVSFHSYSG